MKPKHKVEFDFIKAYLSRLTANQLKRKYARETIGEKLLSMGAKPCGSGLYTSVYRIGNFVVKVTDQSLNRLRKHLKHPVFKKYAPPIHWMHPSGRALICEHVKFNSRCLPWKKHDVVAERFREELEAAGFEPCDLHGGNLVRVTPRKWMLIDYGSWIGN